SKLEENFADTVADLNRALIENKTKYENEVANLISGSNKEKLESAIHYENNLASLNNEFELLKGAKNEDEKIIKHLSGKNGELSLKLNSALEDAKAKTSDIEKKYRLEIEKERKISSEEINKLKWELSNNIKEKSENKTYYENEISVLKEQFKRETMESASKDKDIDALNGKNSEITQKLELYSRRIQENEKISEEKYATKQKELIESHNEKIGYLNAELSSKFESERKVWDIEKVRVNQIIKELESKYNTSQENVDKLAAEKRAISDEVFKLKAEFNDEVISIKSEYEKEMMSDIEESVRTRTKSLGEKLENTEKQNDEMVNLVKFKNDEISKLEDDINEKERAWADKVRNIERDLIAEKVAKLQADYNEKQTVIEEDALTYKAGLEHEYKEKRRNMKEISEHKINEVVKEKEEFRSMVVNLSQKLSQISSKANVLEIKVHDGEKSHRNALAELKKEHLIELEKKVSQAIEDHTSILISKLEMAEDQIVRTRQENEREIKMLDDSFNGEKERMLDEIEKREKVVEASNAKIEALEDELMDYRESSSKAVMNQLVDQEKKFALQLADFDKKQVEV
ncbi:MAG: hypothetical protein U9Q34_07260, partial [Elusimicrobiota bacterium]|nr:hypothetical protein [Elusimicrobiota bacterium]